MFLILLIHNNTIFLQTKHTPLDYNAVWLWHDSIFTASLLLVKKLWIVECLIFQNSATWKAFCRKRIYLQVHLSSAVHCGHLARQHCSVFFAPSLTARMFLDVAGMTGVVRTRPSGLLCSGSRSASSQSSPNVWKLCSLLLVRNWRKKHVNKMWVVRVQSKWPSVGFVLHRQ